MKKILTALALLLCLAVVLTACEENEPPAGGAPTPPTGGEGRECEAHTWGEWQTVTAATCGTAGEQKRVCSVCEKSEIEAIPATGMHSYANNACSVCGAKQPTEGLAYREIENGAAYAVSGIGSVTDTDIVIPDTYNGKPVKGIAEGAFGPYYSSPSIMITSKITSITIPEGVTMIGNRAFEYCDNLTSITIPSSVTSIGEGAFSDCISLASVNFGENSQLQSIGEDAFDECTGLTSVTIPASVTSIGYYAFYGCHKLIEVYNLSSLDITAGSDSHGYVGYYAKVIHTSAAEESKVFTDSNGYIFFDDGTGHYLVGYSGNDTVLTLPANCNGYNYEIYPYAFGYCVNLTSITIPEGVTSIGYHAFDDCFSLTSITIPASVTSIGMRAFFFCTNLTSVTFENPEGWWYAYSADATSGNGISSADLSNAATAATYLTSTYCYDYWKRS